MFILDFLKQTKKVELTKDEIAELLNVSPEALESFERAYNAVDSISDNIFKINAKQAKELMSQNESTVSDKLIDRIVDELCFITQIWSYDGKSIGIIDNRDYDYMKSLVTKEELDNIPIEQRPMLTSTLMRRDLKGDSSAAILFNYKHYKEATNIKDKRQYYHMFRQALDILDLDAITYEMLSMNPNAMGNWLPIIIDPILEQNFFKIPKTTIIKVPLTMLQLTRLGYETINRTTFKIVDNYCKRVFNLKSDGDYFIKTGTYSSKFDFRNSHVTTEKEVNELGEYLLYIQNQACMMAGPLTNPCRYGASTTNEWVVREFIKDKENNGQIYHGLPLHTEYRVFIDFDTDEVIGISPYWEPELMKKRFSENEDSNDPDMIHDYISFKRMENTMMTRYNENKDIIISKLNEVIPNINLTGQWSLDIMQNENDFWIIDMALAYNSALRECIPKDKLNDYEENWLPKLN